MALDRATESRKLPASVTVDHGTEFTSLVMDDWAHANYVSLAFTRPESQQIMGFVNHLMVDSEMNF